MGNFYGTSGDDTPFGSPYADFIDTYGGNDTVYAGDGDDFVHAGDGNDYVNGGYGNDLVVGYYGNDYLDGWYGNDTLYGEQGDDILYGYDGSDTLYGGLDNDQLYGEGGTDSLYGSPGNDYIEGGGYSYNSFEFDTLTGGTDADIFVLGSNSGNITGAYYLGGGFATITDFNWAEGDKFKVYGNVSDYSVSFYGNGVDIYYKNDHIAYVSNTVNVIPFFDFISG